MAILRTCSSSMNRTSATLSVPLYSSPLPSKPSAVQILQPSPPPSSPFITTRQWQSSHLVSEDYQTIAAIAEAVSLASAAAEAAKDAVSSALALSKVAAEQQKEGIEDDGDRSVRMSAVAARRRRRRMRMKERTEELEEDGDDDDSGKHLVEGRWSKSERSRFLTRRQEAEFSLYLKVGAMAEAGDPSCSMEATTRMDRRTRRNRDRALLRARECRERIALSYKRLVVSIVAPYQGKGLSLQDLIQEGSIGLLQGAQRFDHRKGYKLSTYVYWWIKQAIFKSISNKSSIVRLPGSFCAKTSKVIEAKSLLRKQLGRMPTYEEIADFAKIDVSSVQLVSEKNRFPISLDQSANNGEITLKDIIPGPDETRPEVMVDRQLMLQNMEKLLKTLSEREQYIIRLHYGLDGETPRSCDEIGRLLNLSRERIRQIHCNALARLQEEKTTIECFAQHAM